MRVGKYWNIYIENESNGNKNKTISIWKCFDEIKLYLKGIISNLKKSDTLEIQLAIAINFMSSRN